jgi:hypothetical protein
VVTYELINNNSTNFWFWFEKEDVTSKSDMLVIKEHFFSRRDGWNLYGIALDGNVSQYEIELFTGFVKYIRPQGQFTVTIIFEKKISEYEINEVFSYFDKHIVAYSENTLEKIVKGLEDFFPYIFYEKDFIVLPEYFFQFSKETKTLRQTEQPFPIPSHKLNKRFN